MGDQEGEEVVVIFVAPGRDEDRWRRECAELCRRLRWAVAAYTRDPGTARRLVVDGEVDRVVAARPAHARAVALAVTVASDPPDRPGRRDRRRPRRLS